MQRHIMKLDAKPYDQVASGKKIYELRLYDEKRRNISIGDIIVFTRLGGEIHCEALVTDLLFFENFTQLYRTLPLDKCGYEDEELSQASASDMDKYYSQESQLQYAAVAIKIQLIDKI